MLEQISGAVLNAAPALLPKSCFSCGSPVFGRTNHKQLCHACREAGQLERWRKAAEVHRRKNGIEKVKGSTFSCEECGSECIATSGNHQRFCPKCKNDAYVKLARIRAYADDREGQRKRIGRAEECCNCGEDFTVTSGGGSHKYCPRCKELSDANKLPHLREASKAWRRKQYKENPKFVLSDLMRGGMLRSLGNKKGGESWTKLVDYTVDELKLHLERQFTSGMTWENRGEFGWHIDHILPIASFKYDSPEDPEFKACWALTNLRPLWGVENSAKKDKILYLV